MEYIDVWNFRQERFMLRHLRQWSKNFGFGSALSHNSDAANTILFTIQTFNEHSRMAKLSQPYLRGHLRWNVTSLQIQLGLIGTYNFGRLSTLKSNILSTRKLRVFWPNLMLSWVSPFKASAIFLASTFFQHYGACQLPIPVSPLSFYHWKKIHELKNKPCQK